MKKVNGRRKTMKKIAPKKKVKKRQKPQMITYSISVRRNRDSKWKLTPDRITAPDKLLATHLAASKNPNLWVKVFA